MSDEGENGEGSSMPRSDLLRSSPCTCRFLQREADEPRSPIVFDETLNEYHLTHSNDGPRGYSMIYHCPFCGGAAPSSKRGSLFADITDEESRRLRALGDELRSVDEVIARLGPPTQDQAGGLTTHSPESDERPAELHSYRVLVYSDLSETADVRFTDFGPARGVRMSLQSKYVGAKKK
jgi:hypothetical protein